MTLELIVLPGRLAVCRLDPGADLPDGVLTGPFFSVTATADELSLVTTEAAAPVGAATEPGWRAIGVVGRLDFGLTGIMAGLTAPLAEAGISVFVVSTYDTDYVLVKEEKLRAALAALEGAGYRVRTNPGGD